MRAGPWGLQRPALGDRTRCQNVSQTGKEDGYIQKAKKEIDNCITRQKRPGGVKIPQRKPVPPRGLARVSGWQWRTTSQGVGRGRGAGTRTEEQTRAWIGTQGWGPVLKPGTGPPDPGQGRARHLPRAHVHGARKARGSQGG